MAGRIAAFDWSGTALGPRGEWSASLQAAIQNMLACPVPLVMLWGTPGTMIYNDAYAGFAGGRHPFLLGKPVEEGWPEIAAFNRNVVDTCLTGATLSYKDKQLALQRSGQLEDAWMDLHYSPVVDDDGCPAGVLAIVFETTDKVLAERQKQRAEEELMKLTQTLEQRVAQAVTARVEAEERLRQVQKLEAIGGLTGGVAHDFNNVLQIISANLQLIALKTRDHPELEQRIGIVNQAVERGARLASQLLAFARRQPLSPTVVNPFKLLQSNSELLRRALPETIDVVIDAEPSAWNLFADRNQLENALLNLVINSRDAISRDGMIRIGVANVDSAQDARALALQLPQGEYVRFSVTDNGSGMSESVKARVFEPFFSTKSEGHGTGLGLSMVFGFMGQSTGHVDIQTVQGEGTTVSLYFPRCLKEERAETEPQTSHATRGGETILVVEDDPQVRLAAIDMLAQLGYKVLSAQDGDAALAVLREGHAIDVLFTDVIMPGTVRSNELARIAAAPPYSAKVVFSSGYTSDIIFHEGKLDEGIVLLRKPYDMQELARVIRQALTSD